MKYLKTLALAAVAAMALMAVGASAASATVIKAGGSEYSGAIEAEAANPKLTTSLVNVVCEKSTTTVQPESASGTPSIAGTTEALSFTGCKTEGGTKCEVTVQNLPYTGSIEALGSGISKLKVEGSSVNVHCGAFINCTYGQEVVELEGVNGTPTVFKTNNLSIAKRSGTFCPSTSNWDATYGVTSPAELAIE